MKPLAGCGVAALTVALLAAPASAHAEPSPEEVTAGSTETINFTIPHGCDGSPTTGIKMQLPDGVTNAQPVDVTGWSSTSSGGEVSWTGGSVPDDTEQAFGIRMTFPSVAGQLSFPTIQTCVEGENRWIEASEAGGPEPEYPAPVVTVTGADSGTGGGTVSSDVPATSGSNGGGANDEATTTVPNDEKVTITPIKAAEDDDASSTGWVIGGVAAAAALAGAAVVALRKKDDPDVES